MIPASLVPYKGFTLVELLVAIGLFSTILVMATGAYLIVINLAERTQATVFVTDNLSFVFENLMRNVRTGSNYSCSIAVPHTNCDASSPSSELAFTDSRGHAITYRLVPESGSVKGYIIQTDNGVEFRLTDPLINISDLDFYLAGAVVGDTVHPYLRMTVKGDADTGHIAQTGQASTFTFSIQTSAAMRGLDL